MRRWGYAPAYAQNIARVALSANCTTRRLRHWQWPFVPLTCDPVCYRAGFIQDLKRCDASQARVVFVLANKFASDYNQEDSRNVVRAMAIKR